MTTVITVNGETFPVTEKMIEKGLSEAEEHQKKTGVILSGILATVALMEIQQNMSKDGKIAGIPLWVSNKKESRRTNPELLKPFLELHTFLKKQLDVYEITARNGGKKKLAKSAA